MHAGREVEHAVVFFDDLDFRIGYDNRLATSQNRRMCVHWRAGRGEGVDQFDVPVELLSAMSSDAIDLSVVIETEAKTD